MVCTIPRTEGHLDQAFEREGVEFGAIGAAAPGGTVQSVFLYGTDSPLGIQAIFRSDDNGA